MAGYLQSVKGEFDIVESGEDAATMILAGVAGGGASRYALGDPSTLELVAFLLPTYFALVFVLGLIRAIIRASDDSTDDAAYEPDNDADP